MDIVDFHSHILPEADHGSSSVEESLKQLNLALKRGVTRIVATPHFYPHKHNLKSFFERRDKSVKDLSDASFPGMPEIVVGAEILLCQNINKISSLHSLAIGSSNKLLVELPFGDFEQWQLDTVRNLESDGYKVVLAHADRYPRKNIERFLEYGIKLQLNAYSLTRLFARKHLFRWVKEGHVVALGSDIHGTSERYYKKFNAAKVRLGDDVNLIKESSDRMWSEFKNI